MRARLLSTGVGLLVALGCTAGDAGPAPDEPDLPPELRGDGPPPGRFALGERELRIVGETQLQLGYHERATLHVRLTDDEGIAAEAERVSFALVGRSEDVSIEPLDMRTDDEGAASTTLTAGETSATFELRVSADGALDRHVRVSVSDAGFGTLDVNAPYAGARLVDERVIVVASGAACDEVARDAGEPSFSLVGAGDHARFLALPADAEYAVAGFAEGPSGVLLATGCEDGVAVAADTTTGVSLRWADRPIAPAAQLALQLVLDGRAPAVSLSGVLGSAADAAVTLDASGGNASMGAEARFLLDVLDATLRGEDYAGSASAIELADALVQARADTGLALESSLQSLLSINDQGALRTIERLVALTAKGLEQIEVRAGVTFVPRGSSFTLRAATSALHAMDGAGETLASVMLPEATSSSGRAQPTPGEDALAVEPLSLRVAFGALAVEVVRTASDPSKGGAEASALRDELGCDTLDEWLAQQTLVVRDACDTQCIARVCELAVLRLLAAAEPELLEIDEQRPRVVLSGRVEIEDRDGDLIAETARADGLRGEWLATTDGSSGAALTGSARTTPLAVSE